MDVCLLVLQAFKTLLEIVKVLLDIRHRRDGGKEDPGKNNGSGPEA